MRKTSVRNAAKGRPTKKRACTASATKNQWPPNIPDELTDTVADRLKRSLRYAGLRSYEMAEFLEVHPNTVGGYITGKTTMLSAVMRVWAGKVGVPFEWLATGEWPQVPDEIV